MKITFKESITRFKTVDVDPDELGFEPDELDCDPVRDEFWKQIADDGWDIVYCTDTDIYEGEHEPTCFYQG